MPSSRGPKRTILIADFREPRGLINISDLIKGDPDRWRHLRQAINQQRKNAPDRPLARCLLCEEPVYIRVQSQGRGTDEGTPVFTHFPGSMISCPWHDDSKFAPDDPRAAQYKGRQETAHHKWLCQTIAEIVKSDPRCSQVQIERYRRPAIEQRGRFPDVLVQLLGLGEIAIEVQLSKPFATEVVARQMHYEHENVGLVWVFVELPDPLPQGFQDVITSQRGNAFLFDQDALNASLQENTLVLKALLESNDGKTYEMRWVRLDDLRRGRGSALFVEDRRSGRLLLNCQQVRKQWWKAMQSEADKTGWQLAESTHFKQVWLAILQSTPGLDLWSDEIIKKFGGTAWSTFTEIVLILFSLVHSAAEGKEVNYKTEHKIKGMLTSMMNSVLENKKFRPYATMFAKFTCLPAVSVMLRLDSLERKLKSVEGGTSQTSEMDPLWKAMAQLFPEVLNPIVRQELDDLHQLPNWAANK
jgi:hypothetical protein